MPDHQDLREEICRIGRLLYERGFVAANEGNISVRLGDDLALCTPTMVSKGFLNPEEMCIVDLDGEQRSGPKKRTSEILLHLEIYKASPAPNAVVHCHAPHATAFSVAGEEIPLGVLPEVEVILGPVPTTPFETPGSAAFAHLIRPHVDRACVAVLKNHGVVAWGETLEQALWSTEILEAYCRILLIAKLLGGVDRLSPEQVDTLIDLRTVWGAPEDVRRIENRPLLANEGFANRARGVLSDADVERIAERLAAKLRHER